MLCDVIFYSFKRKPRPMGCRRFAPALSRLRLGWAVFICIYQHHRLVAGDPIVRTLNKILTGKNSVIIAG